MLMSAGKDKMVGNDSCDRVREIKQSVGLSKSKRQVSLLNATSILPHCYGVSQCCFLHSAIKLQFHAKV